MIHINQSIIPSILLCINIHQTYIIKIKKTRTRDIRGSPHPGVTSTKGVNLLLFHQILAAFHLQLILLLHGRKEEPHAVSLYIVFYPEKYNRDIRLHD